MHTTSAMILHWGDDESNVTTSLIRRTGVTSDERDQLSRLIVTFVLEDNKVSFQLMIFCPYSITSPKNAYLNFLTDLHVSRP